MTTDARFRVLGLPLFTAALLAAVLLLPRCPDQGCRPGDPITAQR